MGASASTHAASHTGILSELAGFSEVVESRFLVKERRPAAASARRRAAPRRARALRGRGRRRVPERRRPDGHYFHAAPRWTHADARARRPLWRACRRAARGAAPPRRRGSPRRRPAPRRGAGGGAAGVGDVRARGRRAGYSDISELTADDVRESFEDTLHGLRVEAGAAFAAFGVPAPAGTTRTCATATTRCAHSEARRARGSSAATGPLRGAHGAAPAPRFDRSPRPTSTRRPRLLERRRSGETSHPPRCGGSPRAASVRHRRPNGPRASTPPAADPTAQAWPPCIDHGYDKTCK